MLVAPEVGRLADFADFRALDPDRANEGGLGNLRGQISPLEALGIWPTSEFRLSAAASSLPAIVFHAGALLAAAAFAVALPRWLRRHGPAIPAALITAVLLYIAARGFGTVYTSAKALAIAAPLIALVTLGGLLGSARRPLIALGAAFALAAAASSFLVLRQAPVAPEDHMEELAEIRPLVEGEKLLFLGRDNFVLHSLRGSKPFTSVRNFYDPYYVKPNLALEQAFSKFDFDSVTAKTLARFPYVLTTRAAYASGPPPGYEPIARTPSYRSGSRGAHRSVASRARPTPSPVATRDAIHANRRARPWRPSRGHRSSTRLGARRRSRAGARRRSSSSLPAGTWDLSLQYDSTRPLSLSAPGFDHQLAGNLDYRGAVPYFPAGRVEVEGRRHHRAHGSRRAAAACRSPAGGGLGGAPGLAGRDGTGGLEARSGDRRRLPRLRRLVRRLMEIGFGEALLIVGGLLAVAAALSGVMRGTVLSTAVLSVVLGIALALAGVVEIEVDDPGVLELIELALILTLISDGLVVERELLGRHWGPPARALVFAMPITLALLACGAKLLFSELSWPEAFLLGAVLSPTDPVVTSTVVTAQRVPERIRHTLNIESGLNDGLALPFVLFFLVLAGPGGGAGSEAGELAGEAAFGAVVGIAIGWLGGFVHRVVPGGVTAVYEGIYAVGFGLLAYGLADVSFGNGLIAAFVAGITLGYSEHQITQRFTAFSENVSAIFQVLTFFVFGAIIVATGYDGPIWALIAFIPFALLVARPAAVMVSLAGTKIPGPEKAFIAWFGPKGVASMLFAILVLDAGVANDVLVFDVAAFAIVASILAHGLTDTVGASWIERRMGRR